MRGWSGSSVKKPCPYQDMVFPHEVEICDNGKCMICKDGRLEDYADPRSPKYGLCVSVGRA
ncbi:MAG: hypothetical protein P4L43_20400 [Syntrophobacteraceae bacterium]|nr:hypothetical protein [Syntrophobacteraceae bacterium]